MTYSHWDKLLNQIKGKPAKVKKWKKHNVPRKRSIGKNLHRCERCGRIGAHIHSYGLGLCHLPVLFLSSLGQAQPVLFPEPLSERIANYEIDVRLQADTRMIKGNERVSWRNTSSSPWLPSPQVTVTGPLLRPCWRATTY